MSKISENAQKAYELREEGKTFSEISKDLGISISSARLASEEGKKLFYTLRETENMFSMGPVVTKDSRFISPFSYQLACWFYKNNPILSGCVNIKANALASLPLKLFAFRNGRTKKQLENSPFRVKELSNIAKKFFRGELAEKPSESIRKKYVQFGADFVEVEDEHPVLRLVSQGSTNPQLRDSSVNLAYGRALELMLMGNYYLQCDPATGPVKNLLIVPGHKVTIIPETKGKDLVKEYRYGNTLNYVTLSVDEIIQAKIYNPTDLLYGQSPVESLQWTLAWMQSYYEYKVTMFKNMGIPSLIASLKGATRDQLTRFTESYNRHLRGTKNAGKILAINAEDVKISVPQTSTNKSELAGSLDDEYKNRVGEIAWQLGVPLSKILTNSANLASAFVSEQAFYKGLFYLAKLDEGILNENILPRFGLYEDCFLAYTAITPGDEEKEQKKLIELYTSNLVSGDYVRSELGIPVEAAPEEKEQKPEPDGYDKKGPERNPRGTDYNEDTDAGELGNREEPKESKHLIGE